MDSLEKNRAVLCGNFAQGRETRVMNNPYRQFVRDVVTTVEAAKKLPLGGLSLPTRPRPEAGARTALIFSPHPDDEVIIGTLPLRLLRQCGMRVINVAVTQGSNKGRQAERLQELKACCDYIGFELVQTAPNGLENVNTRTRDANPPEWMEKVKSIAAILKEYSPSVIFYPHAADWNSSHIGTHHLVIDALLAYGRFAGYQVETEFWGAMPNPNLMVEASEEDTADLIAALSFHVGEVQRNPYHVRLPAWFMDNVRRGGEVVGGQGAPAPDFTFATLYRVVNGPRLSGKKFLSAQESPCELFPAL